jgi:hypothetical protein
MQQQDWEPIVASYQQGQTADMLQAQINGEWGEIWTVPPCSPDALSRAGRQFTRSRANSIRHYRRAVLKEQHAEVQQVVICTELPSRRQTAYCLTTRHPLTLSRILCDEALESLIEAFTPSVAYSEQTIK